jgi:hypothetical protein
VTACQRVGIRSQVQRLSRPHRGDRRARRRRRGQRVPLEVGSNGEIAIDGESAPQIEADLAANGSDGEREDMRPTAAEPAV